MNKKKRLLFLICALLDGGLDTILVEYLRNIPPDEYDVTLAIGTKMDELEVHLPKIPRWVKVEYLVDAPALTHWKKEKFRHKLPVAAKLYDELLLNPIRKFTASRRLKRLVSQADYVIDFDSTFYTALRHCPRPVIGFYHFSIEENLRRSRRHTMRQMQGMRHYRKIVLICDAMLEEGKRLFPELSDKFVRIYNGYNIAAMRQRAEAPLPADFAPRGYLLSVARLEESQKDITTMLNAYALFHRSMLIRGLTPPQLVLVGEGRSRNQLQQLAESLGIAGNVLFAGFRPDAAPYMANSMALVHSSRYEGFGLVLAEAIILGKPVIATDCPTGPAEILDNGKAGLLIPVGDAEAMAQAMERVATDPALRGHLSEAASTHSRMFDIHTSVQQLLDICK